ncbi:hypothetical protein GGH91_001024 [Coemansia sp. RSA 2671]|nr:hypothetical protein LPJ60_001966 [Coemansia sp. RSA 2675]KAJ2349081.1 hypothetical protein GGH91_001024 [Coemansia sp. RSA 2671]
MPLLDGQPVDIHVPQPSARELQQLPQQQGWQIRFTGEEFLDYDQYLDRLSFYRKPIWTCSISGRSSLTYEQALLSERAASHIKTGIGFSDMLICEMLTFLSQSTMSIALAVDALYYRFQYDFFGGEHIDVRYPDTDGAMYECFVVGIGPLPREPVEVREETTAQMATRLAIERLGEAAEYIIAYEQRKQRMFTVRLYDVDGHPIDDSDISVPASELSRSRNMFTKVALRQFLDDNMRRDQRPGSPWIVCAQWRERFRIPYMYGGEARLLKSAKIGRRAAEFSSTVSKEHIAPIVVDPYADERDLAVKQYRKIPIDDLDYLQFKHVRYGQGILWALRRKLQQQQKTADGEGPVPDKGVGKGTRQITEYFPTTAKAQDSDSDVICMDDNPVVIPDDEMPAANGKEEEVELKNKWPVPLCEWLVPLPLVPRVLSVYMFISCFSVPLALNPYPLDYFESALVHRLPVTIPADSDTKVCSVYRETVVALLNSLIDDRKRNQTPANVSSRIEAMISSQDGNLSEPTADMDVSGDEKPAMDVDEQETKAAKKKAGKKADPLLLPPVSLGARSAKTRANRTIAKQATTDAALGRRAARGRGRPPRSSMLTTSSSIASSEEDSDEEQSDAASVASAGSGSPAKGKKRGRPLRSARRVVAGREGGSSAVSSRAGSPAASEAEETPMELVDDMANLTVVLRPHELLRRLSRTWAKSPTLLKAHWDGALVGWLVEACHDYPEELGPIAHALWAAEGLSLSTLESALWGSVLGSVERRLAVLELLVCECANNERIREYLDECTEQASELKRERLECRREAKRAAEALAELDREEGPVATGDAFSRDHSRREKEQEAQRQKERRRLGESERTHSRRLDYVERELRRLNVGRLTPLGADRFFNKYYFIDGVGGCPASGGGSGRILVQAPSSTEQREALDALPGFVATSWALSMPAAWTGMLPLGGQEAESLLPFVDTSLPAELAPLARRGELWGYYATGSQVDALKRWLDPRGGKREAALAAELELLQLAVAASLRKRCQHLEQSHAARAKARESLCEQISAEEDDKERLLGALDALDSAPVLLPPHMLVERMPNAACSSRGSSAEPAAGIVTVVAQKPARGRKPKNRVVRVKTFMEEFLEYDNILSSV